MEDFLINGVTTAVLNDTGTTPVHSDMFHKADRNGDRRSLHSLSSHIGSGSNQDCLFDVSWISFVTSSTVTESNDENWVTFTSRYWGGAADCVMLLNPGCEESRDILWWEWWWIRCFAPSQNRVEHLPEMSEVGGTLCVLLASKLYSTFVPLIYK